MSRAPHPGAVALVAAAKRRDGHSSKAALALSIALAACAPAPSVLPPAPDTPTPAPGPWVKTRPGVFTRSHPDGLIEVMIVHKGETLP